MSKNYTRRDFLKLSAIAGSGLALGPFLTSLFGSTKEDNISPEEFTLLKAVSPEEVKSLEELLERGSKEVPSLSLENSKLTVQRFPEIAYNLYMKDYDENTSLAEIDSLTVGATFTLTKEGFFLTTYHGVKDLIQEKNTDKISPIMLVYDPVRGVIKKGEILAYSENNDIAIGKVDADEDFKEICPGIAKVDPTRTSRVYSLKYGNKEYINDSLFEEVRSAGEFYVGFQNGKPIAYYFQKDKLKKELGTDLGMSVAISQKVKLQNDEGKSILRDGQFAFSSKTDFGHSGSPMFSLKNDLVAIIIGKKQAEYEGKNVNITICTGPKKIREMLRNYINAVK